MASAGDPSSSCGDGGNPSSSCGGVDVTVESSAGVCGGDFSSAGSFTEDSFAFLSLASFRHIYDSMLSNVCFLNWSQSREQASSSTTK